MLILVMKIYFRIIDIKKIINWYIYNLTKKAFDNSIGKILLQFNIFSFWTQPFIADKSAIIVEVVAKRRPQFAYEIWLQNT